MVFSYSTRIHLINLDSIGLQHVFAIKTFSILIYFDPLAEIEKSPTEILSFAKRQKKNFTYNNIRVQSYDSSSCGLHCLVFCYVMSKRPVFTIHKRYLKSFLSCKSIEEREKLSTSYFSIIKKEEKHT